MRPAPTYLAVPQPEHQRASDMRSSVITFDSRLARRFAYLAADAARYARSDEESAQVERVAQAVKAQQITLRDAHAALSQLRREQQQAA